MRFVETPVFTASIVRHLEDQSYRQLQIALMLRPEQGPLRSECSTCCTATPRTSRAISRRPRRKRSAVSFEGSSNERRRIQGPGNEYSTGGAHSARKAEAGESRHVSARRREGRTDQAQSDPDGVCFAHRRERGHAPKLGAGSPDARRPGVGAASRGGSEPAGCSGGAPRTVAGCSLTHRPRSAEVACASRSCCSIEPTADEVELRAEPGRELRRSALCVIVKSRASTDRRVFGFKIRQ